MINEELKEEIAETIQAGDCSYSSVCNIVDTHLENGIEYLKQAFINKILYDEKTAEYKKQMECAAAISNGCSVSISHVIQHLKLKFPFSIQYDSRLLVFNSHDDIQIVEKLD